MPQHPSCNPTFNRRVVLQGLTSCAFLSHTSTGAPWSPDRQSDAGDTADIGCEIEFPTMGSLMNVRWLDKNTERNQEILNLSKKIAEQWVAILSDYEPSSETSTACEQADAGNWVPVSAELWDVIQQCDQWNRWSEGAFDAGLGALSKIRRQRKIASPNKWNEAKLRSGWKWIEIDASNRSFRTTTNGFRFDFGAIGKGIVVDAIAEQLQENGIEQFVVNASGNMRIGRAPNSASGWPVSVDVPSVSQSSSNAEAKVAQELYRWRLKQCGVATSGDRWQRMPDSHDASTNTSHIIDPSSLKGVAGSHSATVIAKNAADADAIATATIVRLKRDLAGWLQVLHNQRPDVAVWVLSQEENSEVVRLRQMKQ